MTNREKRLSNSSWSGNVENFVHIDTTDEDIEALFGPFDAQEKEMIFPFSGNFNMEDIAVALGKFPSKTQARKNGWGGEIPQGFKEHKIGKTKFWTFVPIA